MFLARMSINRPIMTTMFISVFLIFGLISYFGLNLNLMPDVQIPYVTVSTIYPGAGPKEIETLISKKIEDAISTITMIERVESYSLDGVSVVLIEFKLGKNIDVANQEVKDKVDAILYDLPTDVKKPIVQKVDFKAFPVIDVVLSGKQSLTELYDIADKKLKDRFSQIDGVAKVDITGGQERQIRVELDNKVVFENSISLPMLINMLKIQNIDLPGGYFQIGNQEYTVRLDGQLKDLEVLRNMQISTAFGPKKLQQIANVIDGGKEIRQRAIYNDLKKNFKNDNVIRLGIVKSPEGNVVKVAEEVVRILPEIQASLPPGTKLDVVNDESIWVKSTVSDTISNITLGVFFTSIILFLFLANIRSTFIVALSMPTSIISTFLLLKVSGLTLNMMTLMGLSVSIGVLVANSVVVIENIFRHKNLGKSNRQASYIGTSEVTVAVLASTLTNLIVFLPIANMSSIVGQFLRELALSATFATIFSLLFSFTLTPMLASILLPPTQTLGKLADIFDSFYKKWDILYQKSLKIILKNKFRSILVIFLSFVLFLSTVLYYTPKLGFEFMSTTDDGKIRCIVELPEGYNLDATANVLLKMEEKIKAHPEVTQILYTLGKKSNLDIGTNMAIIDIQLVDVKERKIGIQEMVSVLVSDFADIPNAKIKVDLAENVGGFGSPIEFFLLGQDLDVLENYKDTIINKIQSVPGLINFDNSSRPGKPEITVIPNREKLTEVGVSVMDIALTLRSAVEGLESSKYREYGNEYDIVVTLEDSSVNAPNKIGNITIVSPSGTFRLAELCDIKFTKGFTKILHRDKYVAIQFTGSPAANVPLGNVTQEIDKRLKEIKFPAGYEIRWSGTTKMMNEMLIDMGFAFVIAVLLTYMLLAAILESFIQPIFILLTIPLAMIGVVTSLYYTNIPFNITSLMGIIMLVGIVVNNAILMLDYANQLRRDEGYSHKDALVEACPTKLKPIIMSTLALILGMLPMALGIGDAGKEIRIPLGVVSIGGLLASTLLTLFVVPSFYYVFSRSKHKIVKHEKV